MVYKRLLSLPLPSVKSLRLNAMTTNFNIRNSTAGKMAIKAIIASSHIVLIVDGGHNTFPEE